MGTSQTEQSRFWTFLAMPHIHLLASRSQRGQKHLRVKAGLLGSLKELGAVALKYYNLKFLTPVQYYQWVRAE